jgi:DNA modification methylase
MLMLGDARVLLPHVPTGSVDLIVTDPPYRTISGGKGGSDGRPSGMLKSNDGRIFAENDIGFEEYLPDFFRVLRPQAHLYLMMNFLNLEEAMRQVRAAGFDIHNLLVARKQNATPNRWYMKNCEYVLLCRKGPAFPIKYCGSMTCHDWTNPVGKKSHPTEKSVELMDFYISNSSQPGHVVMDPFMGTGATGIAARAAGRRFIGFEIDPNYYLTACKRMKVMP